MAKFFPSITPELTEFIHNQKIFFVATAGPEGRINLSPKGLESLRVLDENRVVWLNLTGSGNETAAHLLIDDRMTMMFCAFDGKPLILRLYGKAKNYYPTDPEFEQLIDLFPPTPGSRQIIDLKVETVQTSCGYAVPLMDFQQERDILSKWAEKQGEDKIKAYWKEKNSVSIDGYPTGLEVED